MPPPGQEAFGNVTDKSCLDQTLVSVHFLKYKVDWLGFTVQKATCILTYKKDRLEEHLLTTSFFFFHDCTCLVSPSHTIHVHHLLSSSLQSRFPSPHPTGSDFTHLPLSHWASFIYLHPFPGSSRASKLWSSEGDAFFWSCSSCLSHGASQEPHVWTLQSV